MAAALSAAAAIFAWRGMSLIESRRIAVSASSPSIDFAFTRLDRPLAIPAFQFTNGDGHKMTLAAFHGEAILLNLWATWCVPCRKEMPTLDRLQRKLGGPDFRVVPLAIDQKGTVAVSRFYERLRLTSLGIYLDPSAEAATKLGAFGLPTSFLIDAQGREIARKIGPADWDSRTMIERIRRYLAAAS